MKKKNLKFALTELNVCFCELLRTKYYFKKCQLYFLWKDLLFLIQSIILEIVIS